MRWHLCGPNCKVDGVGGEEQRRGTATAATGRRGATLQPPTVRYRTIVSIRAGRRRVGCFVRFVVCSPFPKYLPRSNGPYTLCGPPVTDRSWSYTGTQRVEDSLRRRVVPYKRVVAAWIVVLTRPHRLRLPSSGSTAIGWCGP